MKHWLKFNAVGVLGIGAQLAVLAVFRSGLGLHYLLATALAVEAAILHNFAWHEQWTWNDRGFRWPGRAGRLLRFNLTTGAVSILSNVVLMRLLVGRLHLPYLAANVVAIGGCSLINFLVTERFVLRASAALLIALPLCGQAGLILLNGKIVTVDGRFPVQCALAIEGNKIAAAGEDRAVLAPPRAEDARDRPARPHHPARTDRQPRAPALGGPQRIPRDAAAAGLVCRRPELRPRAGRDNAEGRMDRGAAQTLTIHF